MDGAPHLPRVLVVEDEPLLRVFNADMLTDAGFDVLEAANADEALRMLETVSDIRVVFTDVEMPGALDGYALAQRIETLWPEIGVVITSGRRHPGEAVSGGAGGRRDRRLHARAPLTGAKSSGKRQLPRRHSLA